MVQALQGKNTLKSSNVIYLLLLWIPGVKAVLVARIDSFNKQMYNGNKIVNFVYFFEDETKLKMLS